MTLVMKFGGTSVGSAEAIRQTTELILNSRRQAGQVVVVASAMGSRPVKVTDLLLNGAHAALAGDGQQVRAIVEQLRTIHGAAIEALLPADGERADVLAENRALITRYADLCQAVLVLGELTPRALDVISGMGEVMSVRIVAAYLRAIGHPAVAIDATGLIVTDSHFQNATPDLTATQGQTIARLQPLLDGGIIPIVTGFIAADAHGIATTLGRGGSDYTASILGHALAADEVWIWTDVDGVMTADPRVVPDARSIATMTYREVSELAFYGARVLHPKTMRPVIENNIPLRIKNTFNPDHPGTVIIKDGDPGLGSVKAVTAIEGLRLFTIEGKGMLGVPGIAARTFGAVARSNVSVLLITQASSEQAICFATPAGASDSVTHALVAEFHAEIAARDIDHIRVQKPVAIITVVGAGMRGTPGIAGRVFSALSTVNIIAIAQGSSECSISMVVDEADSGQAVKLLHALTVAA